MNFILYSILVISVIFQSFQIVAGVGSLGYSLTAFIIPIIFILYIFFNRKIEIKENKKLIYLLFILVIVSFSASFFYVMKGNGAEILGENLIAKNIKIIIYFLLNVIFSILAYNLMNKLTINKICFPFVIGYYIQIIILLFEIMNNTLYTKIFQNGIYNHRIRITTLEPSFTGGLIIIFFCITLFYFSKLKKNKVLTLLTFISGGLFAIYSNSKGFYLALGLSFIVLMIVSKKFKVIIISGLLMCALFYAFGEKLIISIRGDINSTTSIATRSYTSYVGALYMMKHPLGTGGAVYLDYYPTMLYENMEKLYKVSNNIGIDLNTSEIEGYIYSDNDKSMASKISIIQYGMYWGILGSVIFISYILNIFRSALKLDPLLLYATIFTLVGICSYYPIDFKFEVWLMMQVVLAISIKKSKGENNV